MFHTKKDRSGQGMVELALIAALVSVVSIGVLTNLGAETRATFTGAQEAIATANAGGSGGGGAEPAASTYTVLLRPGLGTGTEQSVEIAVGETYALPDCPFTAPEGQVFRGWGVNINGSWTQVDPGYQIGADAQAGDEVRANAWWKDPYEGYATFSAGEGTGSMDPVAYTTSGDYRLYELPDCGFTAPEGQEFVCWRGTNSLATGWYPGEEYSQYSFVSDSPSFEAVWSGDEDVIAILFEDDAGNEIQDPLYVYTREQTSYAHEQWVENTYRYANGGLTAAADFPAYVGASPEWGTFSGWHVEGSAADWYAYPAASGMGIRATGSPHYGVYFERGNTYVAHPSFSVRRGYNVVRFLPGDSNNDGSGTAATGTQALAYYTDAQFDDYSNPPSLPTAEQTTFVAPAGMVLKRWRIEKSYGTYYTDPGNAFSKGDLNYSGEGYEGTYTAEWEPSA